MTFRVLIAGSRDFNDYDLLKQKCDFMLQRHKEVEIISGRCDTGIHTFTTARGEKVYGADGLGERYAEERHFKVDPYPADWKTHGKKAGFLRNVIMADKCDAAILFHDGESAGTAMMIRLLNERDKKYKVFYFKTFTQELQEAKDAIKKTPRRKITVPLSKESKQRYLDAHKKWYTREYPMAVADGLYTPPKLFPINSGSAMDRFIVNFIIWDGWSATKISVLMKTKDSFARTSAGIGTFDLTATIKGKSVKIETKHCSDRPSEAQLKMQERERRSGAIAEFVHSIEEFFELYDKILQL